MPVNTTVMNLIFMFPCIMIQYMKMTDKMQLCRIIYYSLAALHVLSYIFAHRQEHLNCITAFVITHMSLPAGIMGVLFQLSLVVRSV
jgi:hypothetical protein